MSSLGSQTDADDVHARAFVALAHTDLIGDVAERRSRGERGVLSRRHAATFRAGGVHCISDHVIGDTFEAQCFPSCDILRAFYGGQPYSPSLAGHALKCLGFMLDDLDESGDSFALATSVGQIRSFASAGKISVVLCSQGLGPLEDEPLLLDIYHRLGVRVLGMATRPGNAAVGTYATDPDHGLSGLGRMIVDLAQQLRIVLDLSAVSEPGFWEIVERTEGPLCASCTNARALCDTPRNFDDRQICALAARRGVIGLMANAALVRASPRPTLSDLVDHVDYIADLAGVDAVCIGPDLVEDSFYPMEIYRRMYGSEGAWSTEYPEGFTAHRDLVNITAELLRRGYSEGDVRKVLGENLLRVYGDVWNA